MANWYDSFLSWAGQGGSPAQGGVTQPMQSSTPFMDMLALQRGYGGNSNYGAPGSPEAAGGLMAAPSTATGGNAVDRAVTFMDNKRDVMNAPQGQVGGMPSQGGIPSQPQNTLERFSDYFGGGLGPKGKAKLQGTGLDWAGGANNFARLAGGLAQAIDPNSVGGRIGGLARTIADNDVKSQRDVDKTLMTGFLRQALKGPGKTEAFKADDYIKGPDGTFSRVGPEKAVKPPGVRDKFMSVSGGFLDTEGNFHAVPKVEKDQTPAERKEEREAQGAEAVVSSIPVQPPGEVRTPGVGPFGMLPTGSLPFGLAGSSVTVPSEEQQMRDQFAPIIAAEKDYERKALLMKALNKRIDDMRIANKNVPMPTREQVLGRPGESSNFTGPAPGAPAPVNIPITPGVVAPPIGLKQGTQGKAPKRATQLGNFSQAAADYVKQFGGPTMRSKGR